MRVSMNTRKEINKATRKRYQKASLRRNRHLARNLRQALGHIACHLRQTACTNFFSPQQKLIEKVRDGAKVRKVHDEAKTPYQRIMDDENVDSDIKERLKRQYLSINPVTIRKEILELVQELRKLAVRPMRGGGIVG